MTSAEIKAAITTLQDMVRERDAHIEELLQQKSACMQEIVDLQKRGREDWRKDVEEMVAKSVCEEHAERLTRLDRTEKLYGALLEAFEKVPAWVRRFYKAVPKAVGGYAMEIDIGKFIQARENKA